MLTSYYACGLGFATLLVAWPATRMLARVVVLGPIFAVLIWGEQKLSSCFALRFPRSLSELLANPRAFFGLLQRQVGVHPALRDPPVLPAGAQMESCSRLRELTTEPMKNATTFPLEIRLKGIEAPLNVFVKLQCGRGAPLWLQAVTKAVEWGMQRESDFYRFLAAHVPLRVPRPYAIDRIDAFNRCCLVLECIEGGTAIADWEGCPLPAIGAMLRNVSMMHAKFLGRTADDAATRWIPAAHGSKRGGALEYVKWVGDLTGDHDVRFKRVWRALTTHPYFAAGAFEEGGERSPLALVHGDCRPGNMLFIGALDRARSPPAVVFADWEAVNVAPPLWDVVYSTTLGIDDAKHGARTVAKLREQYARHLLDAVDESTAAGQQAARLYNPAEAAGRERIAAEGDLLLVVLAFVSYTVVKKNLWNQGNTNDDNIAWRSRVFKALRALDSAALATELSRSGTAVDSACVDAVVATLTSIGEE